MIHQHLSAPEPPTELHRAMNALEEFRQSGSNRKKHLGIGILVVGALTVLFFGISLVYLQREVAAAEKRREDANRDLGTARAELDQAKTALADTKTEHDQLRSRKVALENDKKTLEAEKATLQQQKQDASNLLAQERAQLAME